MPDVKANFTFHQDLANPFLFKFQDQSEGAITSWSWNFGDGVTSNLENPENTYVNPDIYTVILVVSDADNNQDTYEIDIVVSGDYNHSYISLTRLIKCTLPKDIEVDYNCINAFVQKWRLYLQPLLNDEIEDENLQNELSWPPLVNYLIAYLVVYDLILDSARRAYLSSNPSGETGEGGGEVKKIKTGPSEAEFFSNSDFWSKIFGSSGTLDSITSSICTLGARLRITLPMCRKLRHSPIVPKKGTLPKKIQIPLLWD